MKLKPIIFLLGFAVMGMLPGCTSEDDLPDFPQEGEVSVVDINLSFGSDWTIDIGETRAAPPGTGGNNDPDKKLDGSSDMAEVEEVRILAFKRREGTTDPFYYDMVNDQVRPVNGPADITVTDGKPDGHQHWTAHGELRKTYGFEYRVIAIAYAPDKTTLYTGLRKASNCTFSMPDGEQNWFDITTSDQLTYEEVMAKLNYEILPNNLDQKSWRDFMKWNGPTYGAAEISSYESNTDCLSRGVVQTPQLFYGVLHSQTGSEIIGYSEINENGDFDKNLPLSGILYRGVAKVEIKLKLTKPTSGTTLYPFKYYKWIALIADEVATDVNLSSYDGFLSAENTSFQKNRYTAVNYLQTGDDKNAFYTDGDEWTMTTWFLPTRTRLALRIRSDQSELYNKNIKNFQIVTTDPIYSTGNGTGIISPDVVDGVFYLRRNHKYTIEIDVDKLMNSKHELN